MTRLLIIALIALLASCATPAQPLTATTVTSALAGLGVADVQSGKAADTVPQSYTEHATFSIARIAPKGGQVFVCDTKKNCDAIFAYFDALKGLAGPYTYQSQGGRVVLQLNSSLTPEEGARFQAAIKALP